MSSSYFLQVLAGPSQGEVYPLKASEIRIGRSRQNDIAVRGASVSREHVVLYLPGPHVLIEDCGSSYGTYLDGERIEAGKLLEVKPTSQIVLGNIPIKLIPPSGQGNADPDPEPDLEPQEPMTVAGPQSVLLDYEVRGLLCPKCEAENYETDFNCIECGYELFKKKKKK